MSQRNKLILLGALMAFTLVLAYFQLRPKSHEQSASAPAAQPAAGAPATTNAPAAAGAEGKPADSAQNPAPSEADLRELADWFGVLHPAGSAIAMGDAPVFGMAFKAPKVEEAPSREPAPEPWKMEPGKLEGIARIGNGPPMAIFQNQFYKVGDTVRGTNFTIVRVDDSSVTLKSGDRVIQRVWHE